MFRVALLLLMATVWGSAADRPNILWIVVEDQSAHYGPYGETTAKTPNVDRLAREGVKFSSAFVTAPVCSPARSALITGMYQTTVGAHNHRSGRSQETAIHLPNHVRLIPDLMREAEYYQPVVEVPRVAREGLTAVRRGVEERVDAAHRLRRATMSDDRNPLSPRVLLHDGFGRPKA